MTAWWTAGEDPLALAWIALIAGSAGAGALLVALLVVPRRNTPPVLSGIVTALLMSFTALVVLGADTDRFDLSVAMALLASVLLAFAYASTAMLLPRLLRRRSRRPVAEVSGTGSPRIVLSACVEPESYAPADIALSLSEYDATDVPLPAATARPMLYAAARARYRAAASFSPARATCKVIAKGLSEELGGDPVSVSFCERGAPRLDQAVAAAVADGAKGVVVAQLTAAESLRTDRARSAVDSLGLEEQGVHVSYTAPLWGSPAIVARVVERILEAADGEALDSVGVALVGHGQPEAWNDRHPTWTEQETYLIQRVRVGLAEAGIANRNLRLAWLDWAAPDVTDTVRHLAALGCELVLVAPVAMPVETLATLVDLRQAVHFARVEPGIRVTVLDAWGNDPVLIAELAARVREALDELPL